MLRKFILAVLLGLAPAAWSADDAPAPPLLEDAEIQAAPAQTGDSIQPEVTIMHGDDAIFEEYRRNGQLFMVKVVPNWGPAYYLIDQDGNGSLETTRSDLDAGVLIPHWILFSW